MVLGRDFGRQQGRPPAASIPAPLSLSPHPHAVMRGSLLSEPFLSFFCFWFGAEKCFSIRLPTPLPPFLLILLPCSVSCAHMHTDCRADAVILVWIRSHRCPFGVCSPCESATIVLANWSSLRGEYTWLNIDPMWHGWADGRLTMGHCSEEAVLFKSNLHHRNLFH